MAEKDKEKQFSRRDFLKTTGAFTGGIIGGSLLGGAVGTQTQMFSSNDETAVQDNADSESENGTGSAEARTLFSRRAKYKTLTTTTERIYTEETQHPAAIKIAEHSFIARRMR